MHASPLEMTIQKSAQVIAERLIRELPAEEVWLFGSQARGDAGADSDINLLAIVKESDFPGHQRSRVAHTLVREIHFPKDIVVLTRAEWARQEHVVNTLPYIAKKEGVLLQRR